MFDFREITHRVPKLQKQTCFIVNGNDSAGSITGHSKMVFRDCWTRFRVFQNKNVKNRQKNMYTSGDSLWGISVYAMCLRFLKKQFFNLSVFYIVCSHLFRAAHAGQNCSLTHTLHQRHANRDLFGFKHVLFYENGDSFIMEKQFPKKKKKKSTCILCSLTT